MEKRFVAYYRLSRESKSGGLGLDAQRQTVTSYLSTVSGVLIRDFTEIESGKRTDREELHAAIQLCRKTKARLVIAKLDRLARNAAFLLTLRDSGVDFVAADMPHADKLTVGIMAVFAEAERDAISRRTKEALAQAKLRGIKLGSPNPAPSLVVARQVNSNNAARFASNVIPIIREIQNAGVTTLQGIASALNARGLRSPRNKGFSPQSVSNLIARMNASESTIKTIAA